MELSAQLLEAIDGQMTKEEVEKAIKYMQARERYQASEKGKAARDRAQAKQRERQSLALALLRIVESDAKYKTLLAEARAQA